MEFILIYFSLAIILGFLLFVGFILSLIIGFTDNKFINFLEVVIGKYLYKALVITYFIMFVLLIIWMFMNCILGINCKIK